MKPLLLDLFCGAGGCSVGYHRAGFEVVGVDHVPQPRYPFPFIQADALILLRQLVAGWSDGPSMPDGKRYHLRDFAVIHASPPCQAYTTLRTMHPENEHPDLIGPTRDLLTRTGKDYIIENVPGSPLRCAVMLCGSMFGLKVRRHRWFECSFLFLTPQCNHRAQGTPLGVYGNGGGRRRPEKRRYGVRARAADLPAAMGIDWMTFREAAQAIPPAYTEWIGRRIMEAIS